MAIKDPEIKKPWTMEESEGGPDHLTAVCLSWPLSRLERGVCLTDNHQRCYWLYAEAPTRRDTLVRH